MKNILGSPVRPIGKIERNYFKTLNLWTKRLKKIIDGENDLDKILWLVGQAVHSSEWEKLSILSAKNMIHAVNSESSNSWKEAAKNSNGGKSRKIYEALKKNTVIKAEIPKLIEENARLIKSTSEWTADKISAYAHEAAVKGLRPEEIIKDLRKWAPKLSESRLRLIARTEVAKAQAQIHQVRAQEIGLNYYIWETSHDQRVRFSHEHMLGVICDYRNPPNPEALVDIKSSLGNYNAGCAPNCRCLANVIIDLEDAMDLKPPVRMVQGNSIVTLSKEQLKRLFKS